MKSDKMSRRIAAALTLVTFMGCLLQPLPASSGAIPSVPASAAFLPFPMPAEFGTITKVYRGEQGAGNVGRFPLAVPRNNRTVILIQDAHDSLEAQENIAKIIDHLVATQGVRTVFEEGYEGPVPTDEYFGAIQDPSLKKKAAYFFLDHLRLGGAEYAHVNRQKDFELIGADRMRLFRENGDCYRRNFKKRDVTRRDLETINRAIGPIEKKLFPKEFLEWMRIKDLWGRQQFPLMDFLSRSRALLGKYRGRVFLREHFKFLERLGAQGKGLDPGAFGNDASDAKSLLEEMGRLDKAVAGIFLKTKDQNRLRDYGRAFRLLERLEGIELGSGDFERSKEILGRIKTGELAEFIVRHSGRGTVLSRKWESNIREAVSFYESAFRRDEGVVATMRARLDQNDSGPAVLVFGGFHSQNILKRLREERFSYLVISPKISGPDVRHHAMYKDLMTQGRHDFESPSRITEAIRPDSLMVIPGGRGLVSAVQASILRHPDLSASDLVPVIESELRALRTMDRVGETEIAQGHSRSEVRATGETGRNFKNKRELHPGLIVNDDDTTLRKRMVSQQDVLDAIRGKIEEGKAVSFLLSDFLGAHDTYETLRSLFGKRPRQIAEQLTEMFAFTGERQKEGAIEKLSHYLSDPELENALLKHLELLMGNLKGSYNSHSPAQRIVVLLEGGNDVFSMGFALIHAGKRSLYIHQNVIGSAPPDVLRAILAYGERMLASSQLLKDIPAFNVVRAWWAGYIKNTMQQKIHQLIVFHRGIGVAISRNMAERVSKAEDFPNLLGLWTEMRAIESLSGQYNYRVLLAGFQARMSGFASGSENLGDFSIEVDAVTRDKNGHFGVVETKSLFSNVGVLISGGAKKVFLKRLSKFLEFHKRLRHFPHPEALGLPADFRIGEVIFAVGNRYVEAAVRNMLNEDPLLEKIREMNSAGISVKFFFLDANSRSMGLDDDIAGHEDPGWIIFEAGEKLLKRGTEPSQERSDFGMRSSRGWEDTSGQLWLPRTLENAIHQAVGSGDLSAAGLSGFSGWGANGVGRSEARQQGHKALDPAAQEIRRVFMASDISVAMQETAVLKRNFDIPKETVSPEVMARQAVEKLDAKPGDTVLELGPQNGRGFGFILALRGARVTVVEHRSDSLRIFRKRREELRAAISEAGGSVEIVESGFTKKALAKNFGAEQYDHVIAVDVAKPFRTRKGKPVWKSAEAEEILDAVRQMKNEKSGFVLVSVPELLAHPDLAASMDYGLSDLTRLFSVFRGSFASKKLVPRHASLISVPQSPGLRRGYLYFFESNMRPDRAQRKMKTPRKSFSPTATQTADILKELEKIVAHPGVRFENGDLREIVRKLMNGEVKLSGEILDVLAEVPEGNFKTIGKLDRKLIHSLGLFHLTARGFPVFVEGGTVHVVIQERPPWKMDPEKWTTVGGHIPEGSNPLATMIEEAEQELRLKPRGYVLEEIKGQVQRGIRNREVRKIYNLRLTPEGRDQLEMFQNQLVFMKARMTQNEYLALLYQKAGELGQGEVSDIRVFPLRDLIAAARGEKDLFVRDHYADGTAVKLVEFTKDQLQVFLKDPELIEAVTGIQSLRVSDSQGVVQAASLLRFAELKTAHEALAVLLRDALGYDPDRPFQGARSKVVMSLSAPFKVLAARVEASSSIQHNELAKAAGLGDDFLKLTLDLDRNGKVSLFSFVPTSKDRLSLEPQKYRGAVICWSQALLEVLKTLNLNQVVSEIPVVVAGLSEQDLLLLKKAKGESVPLADVAALPLSETKTKGPDHPGDALLVAARSELRGHSSDEDSLAVRFIQARTNIRQAVKFFVDFRDLAGPEATKFREEVFSLAYGSRAIHEVPVRVFIYNAAPDDPVLADFKNMKHVRLITLPETRKFLEDPKTFERASIHLVKRTARLNVNEFQKHGIDSFHYQEEGDAYLALLYALSDGLKGIEKGKDGLLQVTAGYLHDLARQFMADLSIKLSA